MGHASIYCKFIILYFYSKKDCLLFNFIIFTDDPILWVKFKTHSEIFYLKKIVRIIDKSATVKISERLESANQQITLYLYKYGL